MLTVYLCGASREAKRVRGWADKLTQTGRVRIAHRWFDGAEAWAGQDAAWQEANTKESCAARAMEELEAVAAAQLVWVFWPKAPSVGVFVELGAALERKRVQERCDEGAMLAGRSVEFGKPRIVVTGIGFADSLFTALVDYREITDALGFHEVVRVANAANRKG
jgi:hypothetical protein